MYNVTALNSVVFKLTLSSCLMYNVTALNSVVFKLTLSSCLTYNVTALNYSVVFKLTLFIFRHGIII